MQEKGELLSPIGHGEVHGEVHGEYDFAGLLTHKTGIFATTGLRLRGGLARRKRDGIQNNRS